MTRAKSLSLLTEGHGGLRIPDKNSSGLPLPSSSSMFSKPDSTVFLNHEVDIKCGVGWALVPTNQTEAVSLEMGAGAIHLDSLSSRKKSHDGVLFYMCTCVCAALHVCLWLYTYVCVFECVHVAVCRCVVCPLTHAREGAMVAGGWMSITVLSDSCLSWDA